MSVVRCERCHHPIRHDGGLWVDGTDGEGCADDLGAEGVHAPEADWGAECDQCGGLGYLAGQSYDGAGPSEVGAVTVQRCDQCLTFDGDVEAAQRFAQDEGLLSDGSCTHAVRWLQGGEWRVWPATEPEPEDAVIDVGTDVEVFES